MIACEGKGAAATTSYLLQGLETARSARTAQQSTSCDHYTKLLLSPCTALTFKSLAVTLRTTMFNIQKFYMALALR